MAGTPTTFGNRNRRADFEKAFHGCCDGGFGGKLHRAVVGNRKQRADIFGQFALAQIAIDRRTGGEQQFSGAGNTHHAQCIKRRHERVPQIDLRVRDTRWNVGICGEMPNFVNRTQVGMRLHSGVEGFRIGEVDPGEGKPGVVQERTDVLACAAGEVVEGQNCLAVGQEPPYQVGRYKTRATGNKGSQILILQHVDIAKGAYRI